MVCGEVWEEAGQYGRWQGSSKSKGKEEPVEYGTLQGDVANDSKIWHVAV